MEQTEGETECQGESDPLRKEGAAGHSGQSESANVDKKQARRDVEQVLHDGDEQWCARILHAEQPAIEHIETEHGRRAPNEHPKVVGGVCDDGRRCRHERKPHVQEGCLKNEEEGADGAGDGQPTQEQKRRFVATSGSEGLRREAAGAHAEEVEKGISDRKERTRDGDGRKKVGRTEVAGNGRVDPPEQRDSDVGKNGRNGDAQDGTMLRHGRRKKKQEREERRSAPL